MSPPDGGWSNRVDSSGGEDGAPRPAASALLVVEALGSGDGPAIGGDAVRLQAVRHLLLPLGEGVERVERGAVHVAVEAPRLYGVAIDDQALAIRAQLEVVRHVESDHLGANGRHLVELCLEAVEDTLHGLKVGDR